MPSSTPTVTARAAERCEVPVETGEISTVRGCGAGRPAAFEWPHAAHETCLPPFALADREPLPGILGADLVVDFRHAVISAVNTEDFAI